MQAAQNYELHFDGYYLKCMGVTISEMRSSTTAIDERFIEFFEQDFAKTAIEGSAACAECTNFVRKALH